MPLRLQWFLLPGVCLALVSPYVGAAEASIYPKRSQNRLIDDVGLHSSVHRLGVVFSNILTSSQWNGDKEAAQQFPIRCHPVTTCGQVSVPPAFSYRTCRGSVHGHISPLSFLLHTHGMHTAPLATFRAGCACRCRQRAWPRTAFGRCWISSIWTRETV